MTSPWRQVALNELLTQNKQYIEMPEARLYPKLSVKLYGRGVVLDTPADGTTLKMKRHQLAKPGQVILSEIWGKKGAIGLVPSEGEGALCTSHFFLFDVNQEALELAYLELILRANYLEEQLDAQARGSTGYAAVRPKNLLACEIPVPPPEKQRWIVTQIRGLAARIHEASTHRQQAIEASGVLVASMVARSLHVNPTEGSTCRKLGDFVVDDCYGTSEKTSDDETGVPVIRMGNIQDGRLDIQDLKYLHLSEKARSRLLLRRGDILVNRTNSAELVGKCAVFDLDGEYSFASYLIRLRLDHTRAEPRLVAAFINSPVGRAYMLSEKKQMTGQANVNAKKLKALPIALPPLTEQRRIMQELAALQGKVDIVKQLQAETAAELDALLLSILDRAFNGELVGVAT